MPVQPSFDTWTIIFLLAALHGIVVAGLLFNNKNGVIPANKTLGWIILLFAVSMIYYVTYWTGYAQKYPWLNHWTDAVPFLYGPLMYKYLLYFNEEKPKFNLHKHLIPFYVFNLFNIPFLIRDIFDKPLWLRNYYFMPLKDYFEPIIYTFIVLQCLSLCIYGIVIINYLIKERAKQNRYVLKEEIAKQGWLNRMGIFYCVFSIANISYWILVFTGLLNISYDYGISVIMTIFIYWVGYKGFKQPVIVNEIIVVQQIQMQQERAEVPTVPLNVVVNEKQADTKKYRHSTLKMEDALQYKKALLELMETKQPWKDDGLKIQQVAETIGISTHHLSQILNELCGQTWADFITSYRIAFAKTLLSDSNFNGKIIAVGFDCGFSNKSTFNTAFKKATGQTPSAFRQQQLTRKTG